MNRIERLALKNGLDQLNKRQLDRIVQHIDDGKPVLMTSAIYQEVGTEDERF